MLRSLLPCFIIHIYHEVLIPNLYLQLIGLAIISSWFGCIIVTTLSVIPTQEYFFDEKGSKVSTTKLFCLAQYDCIFATVHKKGSRVIGQWRVATILLKHQKAE